MSPIFLYFLFSSLFVSHNNITFATTGVDRCAIEACLCEVRAGPRPGTRVSRELQSRSTSIYFEEDVHVLSSFQAASLRQFFAQFRDGEHSVSIIGYTDGCGSIEYNRGLSARRANSVHSIADNYFDNTAIGKIVGGERADGHIDEARRVDIVVHTDRRVTTAIDRIPADFYLIDASGSMWDGYRDWNDVVNASVKPNSRVFLSIVDGCWRGQYMSQVNPHGGTEIWWSYWNIIDKMEPGETLLIVSDFESNVPLSSREAARLRAKVLQAGINVYTLTP